LRLKEWTAAGDFSEVLDRCTEPSIEVFWTTLADSPSEQRNS
jgi:hypothetical protein